MKFLLDTNVLLNDFFHRHPDFGFQRIHDPEQAKQVEAHRADIHESLLWLSLQPVTVCTSVPILSRLAALLGDLIVPPDLVLEEMTHWLSHLQLLNVTDIHLQKACNEMERADPKIEFDDYLLHLLCAENQVDVVVSSLPKSKSFYWPVLVFAPEKLRHMQFTVPGQHEG